MLNEKIRIRLKAYDSRILDQSSSEIVDTAKRDRRQGRRPDPSTDGHQQVHRVAFASRGQEVEGAV